MQRINKGDQNCAGYFKTKATTLVSVQPNPIIFCFQFRLPQLFDLENDIHIRFDDRRRNCYTMTNSAYVNASAQYSNGGLSRNIL